MDASGRLPTPQRSDVQRNIAPSGQVATRPGSAASRKGNPTLSFVQVAAQVSADPPTDLSGAKVEKKSEKSFSLWENSKMGFGDFVDIINPLQHLPIIATIYRNRTGDTLGFASRVIGGALWGRIGGFATGAINGVVDWITGKDIGDHIYSAFFDNSGELKKGKMVAKSVESAQPYHDSFQSIPRNIRNIGDCDIRFRRLRRRRGFLRGAACFEGGRIVGVAINVFCYTCRGRCFEFV